MMSVLYAVILGAIVGALARLVLPGRQSISVVVTVILGIIGAFLGSWLWRELGGSDTSGIDWIALLLGVAMAALLIVIYGMVMGRRRV